jgi:hypothetical protein
MIILAPTLCLGALFWALLYHVRLHAHNKTHAKTQRRKEFKNILLWACYRTSY